jgi:hypothetical protein
MSAEEGMALALAPRGLLAGGDPIGDDTEARASTSRAVVALAQ